MKVELEYPFNKDYECGYVSLSSEGRNVITLTPFTGKKKTIAYARYLMSIHVKRYLEADEQVDHINDNKTDDRIENLQILSLRDNNLKAKRRKFVKIQCPGCNKIFEKEMNKTHISKKGKFSTCSMECKNNVLKKKLTEEQLIRLGTESILEMYTVRYLDRVES